MSDFEDFIQVELPRRPWVTYNPDQETVPVRRGAGPRQLEFVELQEGEVLGKVGGVIQGVAVDGLGSDGTLLKSYVHFELGSPPVSTWVVEHNQALEHYVVNVYDDNGDVLIPDEIQYVDENTVHIMFGTAITGKAVFIFADDPEGSPQP